MKFLALILLLIPPAAAAEDFQLHLFSEHVSDGNYNERNLGVGYRGEGTLALTMGYYLNSSRDDSFYAGVDYGFHRHFSVSLVGITGYGEPDVVVAPLLTIEPLPDQRVSPLVTYAPNSSGGVFLFSLRWKLEDQDEPLAEIKR